MKKTRQDGKILTLPVHRVIGEGQSRCDRMTLEVMHALYDSLPDHVNRASDFTLPDGTKCWVKQFYEPRQDKDGTWSYGFDVKFENEQPLVHLEFTVTCSGWEQAISADAVDIDLLD